MSGIDGEDFYRVAHGTTEPPEAPFKFTDGGTFLFDVPDRVPAIWGTDDEVLWPEGEALIVAGPSGVGKTTVAGQVIRARIGLQDEVLGHHVTRSAERVLYLAMDRPQQARRALARTFTGDDRQTVADRLVFWKGPPPADLAKNTGLLTELCRQAGADTVVIDSLKDAAVGLSEDEVGARYNRARQTALAAGINVMELHHLVKRGPQGARPTQLVDLYGSVWITAGSGSVVLLWGEAGDPIVDLAHLKQPAEPVGPLRVIHDHTTGVSTVWMATDPVALMKASGNVGVTARSLATVLFESDKPDRNQVEKARRRLEKLVRDRRVESVEGAVPAAGGTGQTTYRAVTHAVTHGSEPSAVTHPPNGHVSNESAGQTVTDAVTAVTHPSSHATHHPFRDGGGVAGDDEPLPDPTNLDHLESTPPASPTTDPTNCIDCGNPLLFAEPGRTRCTRCLRAVKESA